MFPEFVTRGRTGLIKTGSGRYVWRVADSVPGPVAAAPDDAGGCDFRYRQSTCGWGRKPDRSAVALADLLALPGANVLDVGCGEGRNAIYLANRGAVVEGVDVSVAAWANRRVAWPDEARITWREADITTMPLDIRYDAVLACSVLHWLASDSTIAAVLHRLKEAVRPGGLHAIVVFNDRLPYIADTASRQPVLLSHEWYVDKYADWAFIAASDTDSIHTHPGEEEPHAHSITRIMARRPRASERGPGI
jgi:SAM-dependent methyltransferase